MPKQRSAIDGRVGRFLAPYKVTGWVLVPEDEKPVKIQVKYRGETVGAGFADQPKNGIEPDEGRKRFGFVVKLDSEFSNSQARSDDFQVYAETDAVSRKLKKSATFDTEASSGQINPKSDRDALFSSQREAGETAVQAWTGPEDGAAVANRIHNAEGRFLRPVIVGEAERVDGSPFLSSDELFAETGNTGNIAFRTAILRHVKARHRVLFQPGNLRIIRELGEIAVIPCANQLGPHNNNTNRARFIEDLSMPVVAIGLGAHFGIDDQVADLPDDSIRFMRALADKRVGSGPNIAVRGEFTRRAFEVNGLGDSVEVLGCPSLFLNPDPELGRRIEANLQSGVSPKRIAVTAGNPKTQKYSVDRALAKLVTATNGAYIAQHPLDQIRLSRAEFESIDRSALQKIKQCIQPEMTLEEFFTWCRHYCVSFFDVDAWMSYLQHFDFVVGTRIHGTMLGLQAGIPSLCIVHDSRTKELCETMMMPHVDIRELDGVDLTIDHLLRYFKFDAAEFDRNRQMLSGRYRNFLLANRIDGYQGLVGKEPLSVK